jgi:hypothetical protein
VDLFLTQGLGVFWNELLGSYVLPGDLWLWCLHCERFFQAKDLCVDDVGGKEGCAFSGSGCDGAGLEVDIFEWNDWPRQNPELWERWPKLVGELHKGLRCSLD